MTSLQQAMSCFSTTFWPTAQKEDAAFPVTKVWSVIASSKATQAVWEAEELKGQLLKAESELQDARAALGAEAEAHAEAERQLHQVRQHNNSLQV